MEIAGLLATSEVSVA